VLKFFPSGLTNPTSSIELTEQDRVFISVMAIQWTCPAAENVHISEHAHGRVWIP